jgi:hypothetical protein
MLLNKFVLYSFGIVQMMINIAIIRIILIINVKNNQKKYPNNRIYGHLAPTQQYAVWYSKHPLFDTNIIKHMKTIIIIYK